MKRTFLFSLLLPAFLSAGLLLSGAEKQPQKGGGRKTASKSQNKKAKRPAPKREYPRPAPEPSPFERPREVALKDRLDRNLAALWERYGAPVPRQASDAVYLRRAYLKLIGRLPTIEELNAFLADRDPKKKELLIDRLLAKPEFARLQAMRLADMLRIKSEFPINLWPNAVQAYHRRLYAHLIANRSWFLMVREMLTASGSNFRVPYANFCRAAAHTPEGIGKAAALSLCGWRWEKLTKREQQNFAAFFARVRFKKTDEWKEEIVYTDPAPATVTAALPGGVLQKIVSPDEDPRERLARLLTVQEPQLLARAMVNRAWFWMMGEALENPADDLSVPGHKLLTLEESDDPGLGVRRIIAQQLTEEFVRQRGSWRWLFRTLALSAAFQATPLPPRGWPAGKHAAGSYRPHRVEAEVLADMLAQTLAYREKYMSVIPEPFTFLPPEEGAVGIADGSITGPLLAVFGRPSRDEGLLSERNGASTSAQRLFLMNSGPLYNRIRASAWNIRKVRKLKTNDDHLDALYRLMYSRPPLKIEKWYFHHYQTSLKNRGEAWNDLLWTLVNSKEFLYHH